MRQHDLTAAKDSGIEEGGHYLLGVFAASNVETGGKES